MVFHHTWRPLSHRIAVVGGSFVALLSLFHHVPVMTACLRGGTAYVAVLVVSRLGLAAMQRAFELDRRKERTEGQDASR